MALLHPLLAIIGIIGLAIAAVYATLANIAALVWRLRRDDEPRGTLRPVTVLKPLCGAEPGLHEYLRSFCQQDYPSYQIVFGIRDPTDPARVVAQKIADEFPHLPISIVVNPQLHGSNCKISNLINMYSHAQHDVLVMADSDALVGPDYLARVTSPLKDAKVGLVTCLYQGIPTPPIWSRLGAMYINEWYAPSVLLAWLFGHQGYVSGQTVCLRRGTLEMIGGLAALTNHLADDYRLGELVRKLRLKIVLSPYVVMAEHHEPSWDSVKNHELRWMRTLRILRPHSFRWIFFTFSLPLATLGLILALSTRSATGYAWALFGITVLARGVLHFSHRLRGNERLVADLWLVPVRDILLCWIWFQSYFTSQVTWRGNTFNVDPDGVMHRLT